MIIGVLGPEGSCKTAAMTYLTLKHVAAGGGTPFAFDGYEAYLPFGNNKNPVTKTIHMQDWITLDDWLNGSLIDIDEIQQFFDAQQWMNLAGRLFSYTAMQRRKRGLTICYTVQNKMWVNNRIRSLTHVFVYCWDLFWSPWGKHMGINRGELATLTFIDNKGFYKGYEGAFIGQIRLNIRQLWDCFDTKAVVSIWDAMTKVIIKKRPQIELEIGKGKAFEDDEPVGDIAPPQGVIDIPTLVKGGYDL